MTPSWSVVVMWLLVGFVSGGPLTSLDLDNGPSFDPHDGNSTERNGNYTEGIGWPTRGVHSKPPSGDLIAGMMTMHYNSPEDPAPPSFDRHDGNSTERNGNYTESPEDPAPPSQVAEKNRSKNKRFF
ncbi:unnamed protein product [Gadus morhua 'NCC']